MTARTFNHAVIALAFAGIYGLDYLAGREMNLWLLYLAPIAFGTFVNGQRTGFILSLLAGVLLLLNGHLLGNPYGSVAAFIVDRTSDVVTYLLVAVLVGVVRTQYQAFVGEITQACEMPE